MSHTQFLQTGKLELLFLSQCKLMNGLKPYSECHWIESNEIIFLLVARETESI